MPKKTKNRSSKQAKQHRQAKASTSRNLPPMPQLVANPAEAHAALEPIADAGHFTVASSDGQTRQVTLQQISYWHNTAFAAAGQPSLEPGELTEILMHDFMFGRLRLRTDGLWEGDVDYLTGGQS